MEYNIKFTQDQLVILSQALGKLPFEIVAPLINDIQKQIDLQNISNKQVLQEDKIKEQ